jgi:hypothetical protein
VDNRGSKGSDGGGNDVEYGSRERAALVRRRLGGRSLGRQIPSGYRIFIYLWRILYDKIITIMFQIDGQATFVSSRQRWYILIKPKKKVMYNVVKTDHMLRSFSLVCGYGQSTYIHPSL